MNDIMYTSHLEILKRISRLYPSRNFNADAVHDWCAEVENEYLRTEDYFQVFKGIKLPIHVRNRINLPCNLIHKGKGNNDNQVDSIDDLTFPDGTRPLFDHSGNFIYLHNETSFKYVNVDFKGIPLDINTGDVLIIKGHEVACQAYCIMNSFMDDWANNKISDSKMQKFDQDFTDGLNQTEELTRFWTKANFERISQITGNMIPMIGRVPTYQEGGF